MLHNKEELFSSSSYTNHPPGVNAPYPNDKEELVSSSNSIEKKEEPVRGSYAP